MFYKNKKKIIFINPKRIWIFYGKSKWDILPRGILSKSQALRNYNVTLFLGIKLNWARTLTSHFRRKIKHRSMAHIKLSHIQ